MVKVKPVPDPSRKKKQHRLPKKSSTDCPKKAAQTAQKKQHTLPKKSRAKVVYEPRYKIAGALAHNMDLQPHICSYTESVANTKSVITSGDWVYRPKAVAGNLGL